MKAIGFGVLVGVLVGLVVVHFGTSAAGFVVAVVAGAVTAAGARDYVRSHGQE